MHLRRTALHEGSCHDERQRQVRRKSTHGSWLPLLATGTTGGVIPTLPTQATTLKNCFCNLSLMMVMAKSSADALAGKFDTRRVNQNGTTKQDPSFGWKKAHHAGSVAFAGAGLYGAGRRILPPSPPPASERRPISLNK